MKFICNRGALLDALNVLIVAVNKRSPKPELACIHLDVTTDSIQLGATDLEIFLSMQVTQAQVERSGQVVVNAEKLFDIVRTCNDETLSFELNKDADFVVRSRDSQFKFGVADLNAFPPMPAFKEADTALKVSAGILLGMIDRTAFCASKESTRYAFNGILFETSGRSTLKLVATDGRRLSHVTGKAEVDKEAAGKLDKPIVSSRCIGVLRKLLAADPETEVKILQNSGQIFFNVDGSVLAGALIEGTFPPYDDVIPKDSPMKATVGRADLLSAVRRASLMTDPEHKGVKFSFSKKGTVLSSRTPSAGDSQINLALKFDGETLDVGFNPEYFADGVKACPDDTIVIELSAANRPGLIVGKDFKYVCMPTNLLA